MHEREAARLGISCCYQLIDFDRLGLGDEALADVVDAAQGAGFRGLNVTHPFKQAVMAHLDSLSADAAAIGAVNTIVLDGQAARGYNTDSLGFADAFRAQMLDLPRRRVVQFGAGGAGAAVAYALMELGVERLTVVDEDRQRAVSLAGRMARSTGQRVTTTDRIEHALGDADGIVNATPVGMAKQPGIPFDAAFLLPRHWVAEIIYFPRTTELLRLARDLGCRTLDGAGMAIGQAMRSFELFTGRSADARAMAGHFEAAA
jgi:shikimate dehydrogenase